MRDGDKSWVVGSERDSCNSLNSAEELVNQSLLINVEHAGREDVSVIVNGHDGHSVGEGRNLEQIEKRSFGSSDSASSDDNLDV